MLKHLIFGVFLSGIFWASQCKKAPEKDDVLVKMFKKNGELIGFDSRKCGCCWGWILESEGETYLIGEWPHDNFTPQPGDTTLQFPIAVAVEFEKEVDCFESTSKVIATKLQRL